MFTYINLLAIAPTEIFEIYRKVLQIQRDRATFISYIGLASRETFPSKSAEEGLLREIFVCRRIHAEKKTHYYALAKKLLGVSKFFEGTGR